MQLRLASLVSWISGFAMGALAHVRSRLLVVASLLPAGRSGPRWDARAGVWVGEKAAGSDLDIPDPLWIFGYGSLCWRPDFAHEEVMVGRVRGYGRYFAQRSMDHRGTPEKPGLVCTLLSDSELTTLGVRAASDAPSTCVGKCYRVGKQDVASVLSNLDFREKGGYSRAVVDVTPSDGSAPVQALLYTGNSANPNFTPEPLEDLTGAAETIATAVGPSGPNIVYLESLARWLAEVHESDDHVETLMRLLPQRK
jgi:cation transport protein ChaC